LKLFSAIGRGTPVPPLCRAVPAASAGTPSRAPRVAGKAGTIGAALALLVAGAAGAQEVPPADLEQCRALGESGTALGQRLGELNGDARRTGLRVAQWEGDADEAASILAEGEALIGRSRETIANGRAMIVAIATMCPQDEQDRLASRIATASAALDRLDRLTTILDRALRDTRRKVEAQPPIEHEREP